MTTRPNSEEPLEVVISPQLVKEFQDNADSLSKLFNSLARVEKGLPSKPGAKRHAHSLGYTLRRSLPSWAYTELLKGMKEAAQ